MAGPLPWTRMRDTGEASALSRARIVGCRRVHYRSAGHRSRLVLHLHRASTEHQRGHCHGRGRWLPADLPLLRRTPACPWLGRRQWRCLCGVGAGGAGAGAGGASAAPAGAFNDGAGGVQNRGMLAEDRPTSWPWLRKTASKMR